MPSTNYLHIQCNFTECKINRNPFFNKFTNQIENQRMEIENSPTQSEWIASHLNVFVMEMFDLRYYIRFCVQKCKYWLVKSTEFIKLMQFLSCPVECSSHRENPFHPLSFAFTFFIDVQSCKCDCFPFEGMFVMIFM